MFASGDEGFQELFDSLLAHNSTKQSTQMSVRKKPARKDDLMDVDALSKGSGKGKSKGKGTKGSSVKRKGQQRPEQHEQCRVLELWQVWPLREGLLTKVETGQKLVRNRCAR